jgi:hypothetical protein
MKAFSFFFQLPPHYGKESCIYLSIQTFYFLKPPKCIPEFWSKMEVIAIINGKNNKKIIQSGSHQRLQ